MSRTKFVDGLPFIGHFAGMFVLGRGWWGVYDLTALGFLLLNVDLKMENCE
jgi:hypothetical protein